MNSPVSPDPLTAAQPEFAFAPSPEPGPAKLHALESTRADEGPGLRGYIGSRTYAGARPPQHVQNLVIRDYCERRGLAYLLSATEYSVPGSYLILEDLLANIAETDGIVLYSVFMLPERKARRLALYRQILAAGATIHAAVEDLKITCERDIENVEDLLAVARLAPHVESEPDAALPRELAADLCEVDFLTPLHTGTQRDYIKRVVEHDKASCAEIAKQWGSDYWDGDRKYGYGGYRYDGRWLPVARRIAQYYGLRAGQRVLDVGCGKAHLLYELTRAVPGLEVSGVDVSLYGLEDAQPEMAGCLSVADATRLPFQNSSFDFVFSLNTLHNLKNFQLDAAFREIRRVSREKSYVAVESYRTEQEKTNLLYWQLTCESFYTPAEWHWFARRSGYGGDLGFITFA